MNRCERLQDELKAYMDGELPPANRLAVRLHVARCAACREEILEMEQASGELRASESANVLDAALRARILSGAPAAPSHKSDVSDLSDQPPIPLWQRRSMRLWAAAATVVAAWFVLYPVFSQSRDRARFAAGSPTPSMKSLAYGVQMYSQNYDEAQDRVGVSGKFAASAHRPMMGGSVMGGPRGTAAGSPLTDFSGGHAATPSVERLVSRTADITVEVDKLEAKSESVEQMVKAAGGFVANNELSTGEDGLKNASLTVKVPVEKFDATLKDIARLGDVKAKNVTGEDITEKVSDEQQATNVLTDEIANAREKIANRKQRDMVLWNLKIQAAQAKARLEMLHKLAVLSTITVQLREKSHAPAAVQTGGFMDELGSTGSAAVSSFLAAAKLPVLFLIWVLAYSPVWVPLAIGFHFAARANKRRVAASEVRKWREKREGATA